MTLGQLKFNCAMIDDAFDAVSGSATCIFTSVRYSVSTWFLGQLANFLVRKKTTPSTNPCGNVVNHSHGITRNNYYIRFDIILFTVIKKSIRMDYHPFL